MIPSQPDPRFIDTSGQQIWPQQIGAGQIEGTLPYQDLSRLVEQGVITGDPPILAEKQLQPASLDLRLGKLAWRRETSGLATDLKAGKRPEKQLGQPVCLENGALLERGSIYLAHLAEYLSLPPGLHGRANPKSSVGRLDVLARLITDNGSCFDHVPAGYQGPLYLEIVPLSFPVCFRTGDCLTQLRLRWGRFGVENEDLLQLLDACSRADPSSHVHLSPSAAETDLVDKGIRILSLDLETHDGPVAYRARDHAPAIDFSARGLDPKDYFEPIHAHEIPDGLVLYPGQFYLLSSRENVAIPPELAADMLPFHAAFGEFRAHYAGFFDPGFGLSSRSRAVLEVRSHTVPFRLLHGQYIGCLRYERLTERPDILYGCSVRQTSHYQGQRLKLAKQFRG